MLRKITPEGVVKAGLVASLPEGVEITDCTVYDANLGYAIQLENNSIHYVGRSMCALPYAVYVNRDADIDGDPWETANSAFVGFADKNDDMRHVLSVFTKQDVLNICDSTGIPTNTADDQYNAFLKFWWALVQLRVEPADSPREFLHSLVLHEKDAYYKKIVKVRWLN